MDLCKKITIPSIASSLVFLKSKMVIILFKSIMQCVLIHDERLTPISFVF